MGEGANGVDLAPVGVLKYLGNEESSLSALRDMIGKDADQLWATKHPLWCRGQNAGDKEEPCERGMYTQCHRQQAHLDQGLSVPWLSRPLHATEA